MQRVFSLFALVTAAVVLMAGCKKKQDIEADKAAVRSLVEDDTVHFTGGTSHDSTGGSFTDGDTAVHWWRSAQTHDSAPGVEVGVSGDSAWVTWSNHNMGYFHVLALPPGETLQLWNKRLHERVELRGIFLRSGRADDSARGWKLDKISLATGISDSGNTVHIDSMNITSSLRNVTIVDPLNTFYNADTMVTFTPGESLTVTLYTNVESGKAFLHTFMLFWPFYVRVPFEDMGAGVMQGIWHAPVVPSVRFAIFDLLARTTIFRPEGTYDFNGWLLPYRIRTAD
jgi:hypothetical protein